MVTAPRTFWTDVDSLVASSTVVIDRARGSGHPRSPEHIYPLDYGYLEKGRGKKLNLFPNDWEKVRGLLG